MIFSAPKGILIIFRLCWRNANIFVLALHFDVAGRVFKAVERHKCWSSVGCTDGEFIGLEW